MEIFFTILFIVLCLTGQIIVFFGLPGTVLIFLASCLFAWQFNFNSKDQNILLILFLLMILAEGVEFSITYFGPKKKQVSNKTIWVAIGSGILGALIGAPLPILGSLLGMFLGMFLGALCMSFYESKNISKAIKQAKNVLYSKAMAIFSKSVIALMMLTLIIFQII